MPGRRLIFVYNVDASPLAMLKDLYSGITTGTTDCHLCDLTFGRLLKDREWNRFVKSLPIDVDFQLRSTFKRNYPSHVDHEFPAAFVAERLELHEVLAAEQMNAVADLDELRTLVAEVVERINL